MSEGSPGAAATPFLTVDARSIDTPTAYKLLTGCVVPRPVAWITTIDAAGRVNVAPFSSFNYVCHSPPMLAVNIGSRLGKLKDTAANIVATREFTVCVTTEALLEPMHASAAEYPPGTSEAEALGIELLPGHFVKTPRIAASPVHMECRLEHTIPLGRGLNTLYIGAVLAFHLSPEIYDGNRIDSVKMRPIARLGGPFYSALGEIFHRPPYQRPPGDA